MRNWTFLSGILADQPWNLASSKSKFRQVEKSIHKISTIIIGFGKRPNADFFHDQTICIADCKNPTICIAIVKISQQVILCRQMLIWAVLYTTYVQKLQQILDSGLENYGYAKKNIDGIMLYYTILILNLVLELTKEGSRHP